MHKTFPTLASCALAISLLVPQTATAQEQPDLSQVIASVNGTEITLGHIAVARASLPSQYRDLPAEVLFPAIVDQLVNQSLLAETLEGEWPDRVVLALDNESRSLRAGEVVEGILNSAVTDEALQRRYQEEYIDIDQGVEYQAAHILVETEETALEVKAELDGGADFAVTARQRSTGPSGPSGGDLGWFGLGQMVAPFEEAVTGMTVGEISDPIQTQFGWHIIRLNDVRDKDAPELEAVRAELEAAIRTEAVEARIEELTEAAEIDRSAMEGFDTSVLDNIDLSQSQ